MNITTGYKTFRHVHDRKRRPRDQRRYFDQIEVSVVQWNLQSQTPSSLTETLKASVWWVIWSGRKEMFYLTTHSTHFIYGYMASDIWLWTILIVRKETCSRHIGYSFRLTARVLLYAPSHRQDSTYHGLCYTSRGALAGMRNSSMDPSHEGSIRWPIAPWANALTTELCLAPLLSDQVFIMHG